MWNKYRAVRTMFRGRMYDSQAEASYSMVLDAMKRSGDIVDYRVHVPFALHGINGEVGKYIVDFVVMHKDGKEEAVEVKGVWTPLARFKVKMFQAEYPQYKYTVVGTQLKKNRKLR